MTARWLRAVGVLGLVVGLASCREATTPEGTDPGIPNPPGTTNPPGTDEPVTISPPARVAAGGFFTVAVRNDGTVWAWGHNSEGQLGDGTDKNDRTSPVQVKGLSSSVTAISIGSYHTVALMNDGTVWTWGANVSGQLGDGTIFQGRTTPGRVPGPSGITAISAGLFHAMALANDGTVWAWGANGRGQLGDGNTSPHITARRIQGLSGVTAISTGSSHTVALKSDGSVWAWGDNSHGQLGDGTTTQRTAPVQVQGLSGVAAIAVEGEHTVALKNDGSVWAWGDNSHGQLGDGTRNQRTAPVQVQGLSGITGIAAGYNHTVATRNDGTVWTWGHNGFGQLGDGTYPRIDSHSISPVQVLDLQL